MLLTPPHLPHACIPQEHEVQEEREIQAEMLAHGIDDEEIDRELTGAEGGAGGDDELIEGANNDGGDLTQVSADPLHPLCTSARDCSPTHPPPTCLRAQIAPTAHLPTLPQLFGDGDGGEDEPSTKISATRKYKKRGAKHKPVILSLKKTVDRESGS